MPLQTIIFSSLLAWLTISFGQQPVMGSAIKTKPVILAAAPRSVKKGLLMNLECKPELVSHYHYQGKTLLWGQQTNHILISAELYVRCLGHDTEGQYNDTALLYLMELRNVSSKVSEKNGIMEDQDTVEDNEKTENLFADYEVPFEIVQFVDGTVPEIRFSDEEQDDTSKNFKRHLSTIFSTKMNKNKHQDKEVSEFGVHKTKYSKETIIQDASSGSPIVRVHKSFTTDDVVELSGADGDFNDISDVDVRSDSDQHFSDGELISSDGHTVISVYHRPNGDERRRRRRYVDDVDGNDQSLEDLYTADMDYKLELQEKKPYIQEPDFVVSKAEVRKFHAASLISETSREKADLEAVNNLEKKVGHPYRIVKQLLRSEGDEFEEKVEKVMQIVGLEHQLPDSMSSKKWVRAVQSTFTSKVLKRTCSLTDFQRCLTVLQLITLTGGVRAETVVFDYLTLTSGVKFSEEQQLLVIRLLESIDNPSKNFIWKILKYYQDLKKKNSHLANHLLEGLGSLGSRVKHENFMNEMKLILQQELKEISTDSCQFSDKMTHVFKSIGNWANAIMISDVITFAKKCPKQFMYKVLAVEALHFLSHMEEVQEWLLQVFRNEDCEVQQTILKIISQQLSSVHDNRLYGRLKSEARKTFTYLDEYLGFILLNASESYVNCPSLLEEIYDYLEIKSAQQAKEIIFQVNEKEFQFTSSMSNRQKRWTSKNCHSWNFSKDYEIIQSKNEFENDNNLYSNKKHCLAYQQLGNSEIYGRFYAGYFVGATLPKYKLFAKIAGQGKFLSKKFEIGSAMFSLTNENSKFMLKILGKQLKKEETHGLCFNKTFSLYKSQYMSIYQLNIIVIRINLGFTVKPQLGITVNCNNHNYVFKPQALLGVGGYASAQILCVKAGMDADITFNYFLKAYLNIYPSMCYKFTHGYDPMMINFRIWYQVWLPFWWRGVNNWKKFTWRLGPGSEREILKQKQCWQNDVQHSISQTS